MRNPSGMTVVFVGYVLFLLGFVSLGLFVAALAFGSSLAAWAGVALVCTFGTAIAACRAGSRVGAEIWSNRLTRNGVNHYMSTYRCDERPAQADDRPAEVTHWAA